MDATFRALADPSRRLLLDSLNEQNGQTLSELCGRLDMARQSVSKHLALLEAAELVTTRRRGREKLHFLNAAPIQAIGDRWIHHYDRGRVQALADLKTALEMKPMANELVYTTYIRTTPELLWQALTDPVFIRQYWGIGLTSDWQEGSLMTWEVGDAIIADPEQRVLIAEPHRRLSYTWHTITPEFGAAVGGEADELAAMAAEPRSHVLFEIEQVGDLVKLTATHGGFEEGSTILSGVSTGWPMIIASLKSLLETGTALDL